MDEKMLLIMFLFILPAAMGAKPGTFFWKPRLAIDLSIPTTEPSMRISMPSTKNVAAGLVVMVDGYQFGMTAIALAAGISGAKPYPHLDPRSAFYTTNVYRWALRYLSLLPFWLGGHGGHFCETHKVWTRRFYYLDEFVPSWLRKAFPWVKKEEWEREEKDFKRFKKFSEPAFGKHYRYPKKEFNHFLSFETEETQENLDASSSSSI